MKRLLIIAAIIFLVLGLLLRPPVNGGKFTSAWGIRPGGPDGWFHTGSDIGNAVGTPVFPVAGGRITDTGFDDIRGFYIIISHLGIFQSRYYHLNSVLISAGEKVTGKTKIGTLGNTGLSTGAHIHFEIRLFKIPLPAYLLTLPGRLFNLIGI